MRRIQMYDTTLRDGSQGEGVSFSLQDKLLIAERLDQMGFDFIEGGYPLSNEKDVQFFERIRQTPLSRARLCAFGMTRRKDTPVEKDPGMLALLGAETAYVTLVGKSWDFHVTDVLRVTLEQNLEMVAESVAFFVQQGRRVIYDAEHFFDGGKANQQYALKTILAAQNAGAEMVVLCDTNGGSMPEEIAELTRAAVNALQIPVGIHCHNDCEMAVANSLAAVDAGAVQVQGTINGLGERCGNADLISVISNLALKKKGYEVLTPDGVEHLTELSRFVYDVANMNRRSNQPFVGQSAFAHKGGMHVHALSRGGQTYEHIEPSLVGNERRILISELSGRSNIAARVGGLSLEQNPQLMEKILAQVVSMENAGYQFEVAEASFELLAHRCAGSYTPHFERLAYHVNVETDRLGELTTEATVKVRIAGDVRHEVAEGDGPVNALDAALRKALEGAYPNLAAMQLVDYKVRVINTEAATAAKVRVIIESRDDHDVWGTIGVSTNIIEASWIALVDSIEYKLYKDEAARASHKERLTATEATR